jgi:chorismate dehydratase
VAHDAGATLSEIELDPASLTSVALLQCLLSLRGQPFHGTTFTGDALTPLKPGAARLLIGDQALRFRLKFGDVYRYLDLAEEWKNATDLPFVFALWLVRPQTGISEKIADELRTIRDTNLANIDQITASQQEFDREFCRRYYTRNLRFRFGQREKEGLQEFSNACANLGLISESKLDLQLV